MPKLFLLRHLKSKWNTDNRFAGWVDVPLDKNETKKAVLVAKKIFKHNIDVVYSSALIRNQATVLKIFEKQKKYPIFMHLDEGKMKEQGNFTAAKKENYIPAYVSESLNERYYGKVQGLDKNDTRKKFGAEKVHLWQRGYNTAPPGGESLRDVVRRTVPFYKKHIEPDLKKGENILIVASHNSLRAIAKEIENISDKDIVNFEIPFAGLVEYDLDQNLKVSNKIIHNN